MVSMARPFLADANFVNKAADDQADKINTCIACNQACLDHIFERKRVSCLVNPRACYETELNFPVASKSKKIAVVGAGPAGLSFSTYAAERGHDVHLFDKACEIGGQVNIAKQVPGKEEFYETIRYFANRLKDTCVTVNLSTEMTIEKLSNQGFDEVILCTGIVPRRPDIEGVEHEKVLNYLDVLRDKKEVGKRVAVIGAGGIGFDVAEFLVEKESLTLSPEKWLKHWGIDKDYQNRGSLKPAEVEESEREVYLLQRKTTKVGKGLGKTTGWIHRSTLKHKKVQMLNGVSYDKIDEQGLHITFGGKTKILAVDNVILCAGQNPLRELHQGLERAGFSVHLVGGADVAAELDAKRAIRQGAELAAVI